jgi:peptidoglycan/xylan/chitin deacetylase (PgdA/CDA1 family)
MAKKQSVKKRVKKKAQKKNSGLQSLFIFLFAIFVVLLSSVYILFSHLFSRNVAPLSPEKATAHNSVSIKAPQLTPTPTMSIPTPVPGSYCLTVPVLLYHHVEPMRMAIKEDHAQLTVDSGYFDQQMAYLSENGYHTMDVKELVNALLNKTSLPEKSIAITIDDAYEDNYTYAFQILKKYNLKGNFMIPTGLVMNPGYMTWDEIRDIESSGIGFIYNHTWSHAPLGDLPKVKIDYELHVSQQQLKEQLGKSVNIFTYPYGSFSQTAIDSLKENRFNAAFTTIHGRMQCDSNIMTLYREHIGNAPLWTYGL